MGVERILEGQGFGIALTGMTVVFTGLILVSLYIAWLPRILDRLGRRGKTFPPRMQASRASVAERETSVAMDPDLLVAMVCVLHAEHERLLLSDDQRITFPEDPTEPGVWTTIGKMRTLATRM
jgi:Na+-transporting methylmalonyl-CoA/oxaloacetate decarboxylase gamma subunit